MGSRDKADVDVFQRHSVTTGKTRKVKNLAVKRTAVTNFKSKRQVGSGNEIACREHNTMELE